MNDNTTITRRSLFGTLRVVNEGEISIVYYPNVIGRRVNLKRYEAYIITDPDGSFFRRVVDYASLLNPCRAMISTGNLANLLEWHSDENQIFQQHLERARDTLSIKRGASIGGSAIFVALLLLGIVFKKLSTEFSITPFLGLLVSCSCALIVIFFCIRTHYNNRAEGLVVDSKTV